MTGDTSEESTGGERQLFEVYVKFEKHDYERLEGTPRELDEEDERVEVKAPDREVAKEVGRVKAEKLTGATVDHVRAVS